MYDKLKALAEKKTLNAQDKAFIVEASKELDVEFNPTQNCKNCYFDQIFVLTAKIKAEEMKPNKGCDYLLDPKLKIDVIHREVRVNAETLTNKIAEQLIKDGLERWFIVKPEKKKEDVPVEDQE